LGIGVWVLGPIPNPQSPSPTLKLFFIKLKKLNLYPNRIIEYY
jgi:hypothetical protein